VTEMWLGAVMCRASHFPPTVLPDNNSRQVVHTNMPASVAKQYIFATLQGRAIIARYALKVTKVEQAR